MKFKDLCYAWLIFLVVLAIVVPLCANLQNKQDQKSRDSHVWYQELVAKETAPPVKRNFFVLRCTSSVNGMVTYCTNLRTRQVVTIAITSK